MLLIKLIIALDFTCSSRSLSEAAHKCTDLSTDTGMGDCLQAGIPPRYVAKPTGSTQPCILLGSLPPPRLWRFTARSMMKIMWYVLDPPSHRQKWMDNIKTWTGLAMEESEVVIESRFWTKVGIYCRFWTTSASGLGHVTAAILNKEYLMTN